MSVLFGLAMVTAPALAGPGCGIKSKAGGCSQVCAKPCTPEKTAEKDHNCKDANLVIKGMKNKDSETEITKALAKEDGFICVLAINHEDGNAKVCFDEQKIKTDKILNTIKGLGYEVEIASTGNGCSPDCDHKSPMCKKICPSKSSNP